MSILITSIVPRPRHPQRPVNEASVLYAFLTPGETMFHTCSSMHMHHTRNALYLVSDRYQKCNMESTNKNAGIVSYKHVGCDCIPATGSLLMQ